MKKVIVIVGPTASGKTSLGINIAKQYGLEVISGDSVAVYKHLDIGSARPTDTKGITHHLLDYVDLDYKYSVFDFQRDARAIIDNNDLSLIVGGTGLYIKAVLYDYVFETIISNKKDYSNFDTSTLYEMLISYDKDSQIDKTNRRRIIRALEIIDNGIIPSSKNGGKNMLYDALVIYLDIDRDCLRNRIIARINEQLENGFIEEVQYLKDHNYYVNAIGYNELLNYLNKEISIEETVTKIVNKTMRLAKKQKTWFKNQMKCHILDGLDGQLFGKVCRLIDSFIRGYK